MTSSNGNIFRVTGHLCGGIHRSSVNSPHKGQWRGALMFSLIGAWINRWVNNGEAGDFNTLSRSLWRHCNVAVTFWAHVFVYLGFTPNSPYTAKPCSTWTHHDGHGSWFIAGQSSLVSASEETKISGAGRRFNIKMSSYQYRKSHCGDKTVVRSSYLHNGISYSGKMASLYWISPLVPGVPCSMIAYAVWGCIIFKLWQGHFQFDLVLFALFLIYLT